MIGNLGREIQQDRDMFANLAQHVVLCAQTNSLQARFPDIQLEFGETDTPPLSARAHTFDGYNGYAFHPRCEERPPQLQKMNVKLYYSTGIHRGGQTQTCGHMPSVVGLSSNSPTDRLHVPFGMRQVS